MTLELSVEVKPYLENVTTPVPHDIFIALYNILARQQQMLDEYKSRLNRKDRGAGRPRGSTVTQMLPGEDKRDYVNRYQRELRARKKAEALARVNPL